MSKLKIVSGKNLIRVLEKNGFAQTRQVGSHVVLVKNDLTITVPLHGGRDLGRGIILSILKDAKIERTIYEKSV
ncbi:MAG: type II toxin-antitoxin system HicA family toxin [Patescibacteria group bacterium]